MRSVHVRCLFSGTGSLAETADSSENLDLVCSELKTMLAQDACADVCGCHLCLFCVLCYSTILSQLSQCILQCTLV